MAILMLSMGVGASAQTSGSLSLVSNYLYRGVSLSEGNAVPQASVNYDSPDGWFVGLFGSRIEIPKSPANVQLIAYEGYSHRWLNGVSWETGFSETHYQPNSGSNYVETFAGLSSEHMNGRLYYSPNYQGHGVHGIYAEFNADYPLLDTLSILAHVGYLHVPEVACSTLSSHGDTRFGIGSNWGSWNFQLAWVALVHEQDNCSQYDGATNRRNTFLGMSYSF